MNDQSSITKYQTISNIKSRNDQPVTTLKNKYDLEVRTTNFARKVILLCKLLPKNTINLQLISQLVRSSGSVGANYREANDSLSKKDFSHRLKITRKEAKESCHWLELVLEANRDFEAAIHPLMGEAEELKKIFSSIIIKSQ